VKNKNLNQKLEKLSEKYFNNKKFKTKNFKLKKIEAKY